MSAMLPHLAGLLALAQQGEPAAFPADRYGVYERCYEGLRGPVDAVQLADGALVIAERDADRLIRIAPDGARAAFGPSDLDAPEDVALLPGGGFAVADTGHDRVLLLDAAGGLVRALPGPFVFRAPTGVAASAERLYVADPLSGRVAVLDHDGQLLHALALPLVRPVAVELGPGGEAFVVDAGTHRIEVFGADGKHLRGFGDFGPDAGLLGHPRDLALAGGRVLVADSDNHRIEAFDASGAYVYEWGKHALRPREGEGSLHYPSGIALSPDGARAFVCEAFGDRVQVFGRTDEDPQRFMTEPGLMPWKSAPHYGREIATAGDLLVTFEPETQSVLVHDLELDEPVEVTRFTGYGDGPGLQRDIGGLCVDPHGFKVLVTDRLAGTLSTYVLKHEPDAPLRMDPRMASFARAERLDVGLPGRPARPGALALAADGALAVIDEASGDVCLVKDGRVARRFGGLDEPVAVAFGGEELYVADRGARAVAVFGPDGERRRTLKGCERPRGVAVAADGNVYVTDETAHRVRVFGMDGALRFSFGEEGLGAGQLLRPAGIALDQKDRVIVLDHGNHRGMIFDRKGGFLLAFGPRGYTKPTRGDAAPR